MIKSLINKVSGPLTLILKDSNVVMFILLIDLLLHGRRYNAR